MQPGLSFDQAPPFSAPLRFFLTAPLFAVLAALVLLAAGPDAWVSRWTPTLLATTHLITLGFMAMVMMGALLQILPVVAGSRVPKPVVMAGLVHATLSAGTLALASGLFLFNPALLKLALILLGASFVLFLAAAGYGVWQASAGGATVASIGLALVALAVTVAFGIGLASALSGMPVLSLLEGRFSFSILQVANLHLVWGLLGWVGLLVMGVAYQVVPMFQMTPAYPKSLTQWLAKALFAVLVLWSVAGIALGDGGRWQRLLLELLAAAGFVTFAVVTLRLQQQRKRRQADATLRFWRTGMASVMACAMLWALAQIFPGLEEHRAYSLLMGLLLIVGFGVSVINGMLYKIVPFLAWFHLQSRFLGRGAVPNVKEILPNAKATRQLWAHWAAGALLLGAALWPALLTYPAALALAVSALWLWANLLSCWRIYRDALARLEKPA